MHVKSREHHSFYKESIHQCLGDGREPGDSNRAEHDGGQLHTIFSVSNWFSETV